LHEGAFPEAAFRGSPGKWEGAWESARKPALRRDKGAPTAAVLPKKRARTRLYAGPPDRSRGIIAVKPAAPLGARRILPNRRGLSARIRRPGLGLRPNAQTCRQTGARQHTIAFAEDVEPVIPEK